MTMETTRRSALFRTGGGLLGVAGAVLAACAPTGQGGPAPQEVSGTVEVLSWGEGDPAQPGWQARMTAFKARAPQLTVESVVSPFGNGGQAYDEKLIALAVAGTPPDVTFTDGTRLSNFAPRGIIRELDDFMARVKFDKGNYPKATWVANERKGKTIALPYRAQPYPFYVNHDLYTKAGLKPPTTTWTLDDLREQGRRLTASDGSQWGIGDLASTVSRYSMFIWAAGGDFFDKGYTRCTLDAPPAVEGLQQIADLVTRDRTHVPPGTQGVAFGTGNLALSSNGAGRLPPAQPWTFRWGLATMPRGARGADVCLITNDWAILKGARNPEGAWRLLEWFSGDEGQKILADEDTIPANLKVARQSAYTKLDADSRRAALAALDNGRPLPYDAPLWGEVRPLWENELPGVWKGETTVRDLMQRVVPLVNERLKTAPR
jgi:multiple sugar transport system substrate-binding protein